MLNIAVIGAGSWGTALAIHLGRIGHDVRLWGREDEPDGGDAGRAREYRFLPGFALPPSVRPTADLAEALEGAGIVLVWCLRTACARPCARRCRMCPRRPSSPARRRASSRARCCGCRRSWARRPRARGQSSSSRVPASPWRWLGSCPRRSSRVGRSRAARLVQREFRGPAFRLYGSDDVVGVEIGGALKNVIAIAAGVVESLGLGHNALARSSRGASPRCPGWRSRWAGVATRWPASAGSGPRAHVHRRASAATAAWASNSARAAARRRARGMTMVAEGVRTTHAALALGERHGIELPIRRRWTRS